MTLKLFNMVTENSITTEHDSYPLLQHRLSETGIVIIGRNEGERLRRCISSIPRELLSRTIYVDSGSTDNSKIFAKNQGLITYELDMSQHFTAARARNAGFNNLLKHYPELRYVHFIDGDCSFAQGWINFAIQYLENHPEVAITCGQRREIHPNASVYNWLCDIEWNTPIGETYACGGDFLVRTNVFKLVGGFKETLIAGEEPELCYRIRCSKKKIVRLNHDMTWHDANMHHFRQWFRRNMRAGYAFAEAVFLYRSQKDGYWRRELFRIVIWGITLPSLIFAGMFFKSWILLISLIYPLQMIRISLKLKGNRKDIRYGFFMVLAKFPEAAGSINYIINRLTRSRRKLIEYK